MSPQGASSSRSKLAISVVTAVFNRRDTIGASIAGTLAQRDVGLELVIQDGGSTDGTLETIRGFEDPRIALESGPDAGIYDAINRGIARARGDVIGLMHSDDTFARDQVLSQVAALFEDPDVDGVYGDLDYVSAADPDRIIRRWRSGTFTPDKLAGGWMPPHPTLYLRREVFGRWGAYDTDFRIAADYEAMLRWLVRGGIRLAYLPEVMVKMRVGGESNRSLERILLKSQEDYRAIRRHGVGGLGTLAWKNFGKLGQFIRKDTRPT
ncbi:MAG: glycosyltransferase family 2 protein [Pseudomonadota bacterium]